MTKSRDLADSSFVNEPIFTANAIGDYFGIAYNLENNITSRIALLPLPRSTAPTSISSTGTFDICDELGNTVSAVTSVDLYPDTLNNIVGVRFNTASLFNLDPLFTIRATSADASITLNY